MRSVTRIRRLRKVLFLSRAAQGLSSASRDDWRDSVSAANPSNVRQIFPERPLRLQSSANQPLNYRPQVFLSATRRAHRLVEAGLEAALVEDVGVDGVQMCACQLAMGPSWVARPCMMQHEPRDDQRRQCLSSLIISIEVTDTAKPRSKRPPGDATDGEDASKTGSERPVRYASAFARTSAMARTAQKEGCRGPRWARGSGRRRGTCPRRRCSRRGCTGSNGEPGDAGAVLGGPFYVLVTPSIAQRPLNHLTLAVLLGAEGAMERLAHRRGRPNSG